MTSEYEPKFLNNDSDPKWLIEQHDKQIQNLMKELNTLKAGICKEDLNNRETTNPIERLKHTFLEFVASSWCYGLSKLLHTKRLVFKFMWLIFILTSTGLCCLFVFFAIRHYTQWNVVTEAKIIYNQTLIFPQVIFCKDNNKKTNDYTIYSCEFDRVDCRGFFDEVNVFDDKGVANRCLRFNGGRNMTNHEVPLKYQTGETSIYDALIVKLTHADPDLNLVYINEQGESPSLYSADLLIDQRQMASISLSWLQEKKLQYPYNSCEDQNLLDTGVLVALTKKFNNNYDHQKCLHMCFFYRSAIKHKCSYTGIFEQPAYSNSCIGLVSDHEQTTFNYSSCMDECPITCETKYFTMITNHHYNQYNSNTFKLFLYFKTLKYTSITQIPKYTFTDLVSSIGGTLGLFVGLRLLSFVDILQFLLEMLFLVVKKFRVRA